MQCPNCGGVLERDRAMHCASCGAEYAIVEGVPLLVSPHLTAQHEHQREYFDAEFSEFDRYRVDNWRESFNRRMFPALRVEAGNEPYLDVGVGGSGATVIEAARAGVEAVGCDLSVEGVLHAARFATSEGVDDRTTFVVCAAERLPFADSTFASASAVAVLEHLDDDEPAAAELARVLRPGGRVWVTVPHAYRYLPPFVWPLYAIHDRRIGHKRHYDEARMRALFARQGLRHLETQYSGHLVKLAQYALTLAAERARRPVSQAVWWTLERADLRALRRPLWALQLSAVFEKPA